MELHNKIAKISLEHFKNLPKRGKPTATEWTVLSCVIKVSSDSNEFEVVALGTGSKCIGKGKMSSKGDVINDSHGEVICRRAFLNYLYYEIEQCIMNKSDTFIFNSGMQKLVLKNNISFHFFTTQVPCGDAAIFPKVSFGEVGCSLIEQTVNCSNVSLKRRYTCVGDMINNKRIKLCPSSKTADIFRTGAKCLSDAETQDAHLNGVDYHVVGVIRTKPGRGDPTLSVSCSDKLAKWLYLGVQGSLLMMLLDKPIYFKSVTVAGNTPYNKTALQRALYKRFDNISSDFPYEQHPMICGQVTFCFEFTRCNSKWPSPSSIIWNKDHVSNSEVAVNGRKQGTTKKKLNTASSAVKICKMELFKRFINIANLRKISALDCDFVNMTYKDAKSMAIDYQKAWTILKQEVFKIWTVKDPKLLEFYVDR